MEIVSVQGKAGRSMDSHFLLSHALRCDSSIVCILEEFKPLKAFSSF
jgi:hypothetical protein